jgi:hypothetical protein
MTTDRSRRPVILIGAARSGTKFLRDLLASDKSFARVPYDVNYVWRTGNFGVDDDALRPEMLTDRLAARIRQTLYQLAGMRGGEAEKRLIEKTVSNTLRVPFVDRVFPDALYVHLLRDGRAVIESSMRMWQAPPDRRGLRRKLADMPWMNFGYVGWFLLNYLQGLLRGRAGGAVWGPRYPGVIKDIDNLPLVEVVARQWAASVESASRGLAGIAGDRVFTLRYETLMREPAELERLCDFLAVSDRAAIRHEFAVRADSSNLDKWRSKLSAAEIEGIGKVAGECLRAHGYLS